MIIASVFFLCVLMFVYKIIALFRLISIDVAVGCGKCTVVTTLKAAFTVQREEECNMKLFGVLFTFFLL